jgi:hypothetical protein
MTASITNILAISSIFARQYIVARKNVDKRPVELIEEFLVPPRLLKCQEVGFPQVWNGCLLKLGDLSFFVDDKERFEFLHRFLCHGQN